jgi:GT2 family glycosyltransferase
MKFSIGIPTLNRIDLLNPSLKKYEIDFPDIEKHIIDNGRQSSYLLSKDCSYFIANENYGVAKSWNYLCNKIFEKNDYALILNDDIYLGTKKTDIENLIKQKPDKLIKATPDWCAFIMPKSVYQRIGKFDECFYPAYYEDKSYEYRVKLAGLSIIKSPILNPVVYKTSQTLEFMPSIHELSKKNKKIYIEMWGGEPEREKFKKPYNR